MRELLIRQEILDVVVGLNESDVADRCFVSLRWTSGNRVRLFEGPSLKFARVTELLNILSEGFVEVHHVRCKSQVTVVVEDLVSQILRRAADATSWTIISRGGESLYYYSSSHEANLTENIQATQYTFIHFILISYYSLPILCLAYSHDREMPICI